MSKSFWNKELPLVFGTESHDDMVSISGTSASDVNGNVKHSSARRTQQLRLAMWWLLKVQPTDYIFRRTGFVVLNELHIKPCNFLESSAVKRLKEIPPVVLIHIRLQNEKSFNIRGYGFHRAENIRCHKLRFAAFSC